MGIKRHEPVGNEKNNYYYCWLERVWLVVIHNSSYRRMLLFLLLCFAVIELLSLSTNAATSRFNVQPRSTLDRNNRHQEWAETKSDGAVPSALLYRKVLNDNTPLGKRCMQGRDKDCIQVVIAANGPYLVPLMACMNSMLQHTTRIIGFHLLIAEGETAILETPVLELVGGRLVEFVEFNTDRVQSLIKVWKGLNRHSNALNHARFYLPELFPSLSTTIYLDPDTIVKADIGEIWDTFLERTEKERFYFSAVVSKKIDIHSSTYSFLVNCDDPLVRSRVTNPQSKYFNAGVFVTDLQRWREDDVTGQLEFWMKENKQRKLWNWGSQAPLSLVFYGKWQELKYEWNERRTKYRTDEENRLLSDTVKIYHFTGEPKPWKNDGGPMLWNMWCPYYPKRNTLWFCKLPTVAPSIVGPLFLANGNDDYNYHYLNLLPSSPLDYGFIRNHFVEEKKPPV